MTGMLIVLLSLLAIPILRMSRADKDLVESIRYLIKTGEESLKAGDRERAELNFKRTKWKFIQMESSGKKKMILKEIQKYHGKIKDFSEF